jgi:hypothetical protein
MAKSDSLRRRPYRSSEPRPSEGRGEKGVALIAALVFTLVLTILGFSMLIVAGNEITSTQKDINKTKAFYLAEAGIQVLIARLNNRESGNITETTLGEGIYRVDYYGDAEPPYAISTGRVKGREKRIKVTLSFLAPPYDSSIYAANLNGLDWTLLLSGTGSPKPGHPHREDGGKDIINGNVFVNGDVDMFGESSVNPAPAPNTYELNGDVNATGSVTRHESATISGDITQGADPLDTPDLVGMNYAVNNTYDVAHVFATEDVSGGHLVDHELREVFMKNPPDRSSECDSTTVDDYFLEPVNVHGGGTYKDAPTPLHLGNNVVYYVDGDVWVDSQSSYGFTVDGKATIVATGNIHLSDNLKYADANSDILGLVALGNYDEYGDLVSGGNIYFGDPRYGTVYVTSALMFAADDFLYNTDSVTHHAAEPESGFIVNGNLSALNTVSVERDWYTRDEDGEDRPAQYQYDSETHQWKWVDAETGEALSDTEINGKKGQDKTDPMRHYQMVINYDERVRNQDTRPRGLPRGTGAIFNGIISWEELP